MWRAELSVASARVNLGDLLAPWPPGQPPPAWEMLRDAKLKWNLIYPFTTLVSSLRSKRRNCLVVVREKVGDAPQEGAAGAQLPSMDPLQLPFRPRW